MKTTTGNTEPEPLGIRSFSGSVSRVFSSLLLMSTGDPSKLLTSLNTFATGNDRAPTMTEPENTEPEIPGCERVVLSEDRITLGG